MLRTILNGWNTEHRHQRKDTDKSNWCLLGCPRGAEDSLEHYCCCPVIHRTLRTKLRLSYPVQQSLSLWTLDHIANKDTDILKCNALINYAAYMATNMFRKKGRANTQDIGYHGVCQHLIQSARRHSATARFLDSRWQRDIKYVI